MSVLPNSVLALERCAVCHYALVRGACPICSATARRPSESIVPTPKPLSQLPSVPPLLRYWSPGFALGGG